MPLTPLAARCSGPHPSQEARSVLRPRWQMALFMLARRMAGSGPLTRLQGVLSGSPTLLGAEALRQPWRTAWSTSAQRLGVQAKAASMHLTQQPARIAG